MDTLQIAATVATCYLLMSFSIRWMGFYLAGKRISMKTARFFYKFFKMYTGIVPAALIRICIIIILLVAVFMEGHTTYVRVLFGILTMEAILFLVVISPYGAERLDLLDFKQNPERNFHSRVMKG